MSFREEVKVELQAELPKDPVHECVKILAGSSPDYERLRTGTGFSNKDTLIGKQLAGLPSLGRNQFKHAQKLIKGYADQLPPDYTWRPWMPNGKVITTRRPQIKSMERKPKLTG